MNRSSPAWTWTTRASGEPDGSSEAGADGDSLAASDGDSAGVDGDSGATDSGAADDGATDEVVVPEQAARVAPASAIVAPRRRSWERVIVTSERMAVPAVPRPR